jgi:hypothetical protein
MTHDDSADLGRLGRQSLRRPLSRAEAKLAQALEEIFASGRHDFSDVAVSLGELKITRPSGSTEPWSVAGLESELRLINASLDDAYTHRRTDSSR